MLYPLTCPLPHFMGKRDPDEMFPLSLSPLQGERLGEGATRA